MVDRLSRVSTGLDSTAPAGARPPLAWSALLPGKLPPGQTRGQRPDCAYGFPRLARLRTHSRTVRVPYSDIISVLNVFVRSKPVNLGVDDKRSECESHPNSASHSLDRV